MAEINSIDSLLYLSENSVRELSPLVLAYVGDSIYDLYIKTWLAQNGNGPVNKLHKLSTHYVSARAQASIVRRISEVLTFEESEVLRRGRNAKSATVPKNCDVVEYRIATGFESLIGYLYLTKKFERMIEIFKMCIEEKKLNEEAK